MLTPNQLDIITKHYLAACLWADCPEGTNPRITKASENVARVFCEDYVNKCGPLFDQAIECYGLDYFGHDVYLTSMRHGAGFWDRDQLRENSLGQKLTDVFKDMDIPKADFYRGWLNLQRWNPITQEMHPDKPQKVCFKQFEGGECIAVLNGTKRDCNPGKLMSYMRIGQHGEIDPKFYHRMRLSTPDEYAPLLRELRHIYQTVIIPVKRICR